MVRSHSFVWILVSLLSLTLATPLRAGIIPSGDVDPADYSWWHNGGDSSTDAYIGNTAAGSVIVNLGSDLSSWEGSIGYSSGSAGAVMVDGVGSTWTNGHTIYVGYRGHGTLNITNGGAVSNDWGFIGKYSGSTGVVTVDGSGSTWTHSGLNVGHEGHGTLHITNGGAVSNTDNGYIGYWYDSTGVVTVDGSGSTWTNSGYLRLGITSGHGTLNITNGGAVSTAYGYIGYGSGSTGEVTVNGSGSTWTNSGYLHVGDHGHGTLNITNGGVVSTASGSIGYGSGSTGVATVDGSGSTWTFNRGLNVGYRGQGTLNIINGGTVVNDSNLSWDPSHIGYYSGSTGEVTVDGSGSTWTNSDSLLVGRSGRGTLNITAGGAVNVTRNTWVAIYDGAVGEINFDSGTLTTGSLFAGATQLTGTGTINTHGLVSSDVDLLFNSDHGPNQTLTLNSQPGQNITINLTQDSTGHLGAGYAGEGTLSIRDGVSVDSYYGYIGYKAGATGVVTVDGSGSTWASGDLNVGCSGQGTLNITNGGTVSNTASYIGLDSGSTGVVTVDGGGSTLTCGWLSVGHGGTGTLNITNDGAVNVTYEIWVAKNDGTAGEIHFDGGTLTTRSLLAEPTRLTGTGTINTYGLVSDVDLMFDSVHGLNQTLMFNNQPDQNITINLTQDWRGVLGAGYAGEGTLAIRDGVSVKSADGCIGYKAGSTGVVTVDGAGSTWTTHGGDLRVGFYGHGTLHITNGGAVSSYSGSIGRYSGSTGVVTVDSSGSTLTNSWLFVGRSGQGTLNITNGGAVSTHKGYIGGNSGATGVVTVAGSGSTWTCGYSLRVGDEGQGTLNITGGGLVSVADTLTIDENGGGNGFINMATGGMLALYGDADDSLTDFLGLIDGTNAIRYWDDSILDWADITGATYGEDYTLIYLTEGDLAGYTMLTVPEPATMVLLMSGGVLAMLQRRR
ncbi:MAG: PEP-CTERM sorting domain-containing protein [Phycisphaerae bacterium]|nr:PEP-CTERM sorting domain-containing protein [Phycisphaerae bacterium]